MPTTGDFMLVKTPGWRAKVIQAVTRSEVNHAVVLVNPGQIVEADPGGAQEVPLDTYDGMPKWWSRIELTTAQRRNIAVAARALVGTPYSWMDVLCVGLAHLFGVHVPARVRARLSDPSRLMCSQLVDAVYLQAGVHLFTDGRLPGDVSPGDLLDLVQGRTSPVAYSSP